MIAQRLFDEAAIAARVREIGAAITSDYAGKNPMIVGVLTSSAVFVADLTRAIPIPCEFDFIALSRYGDAGGIRFIKDTSASIEGRHVVLVEDTIDTGLTLQYITQTLARARAGLAGSLHAARSPAPAHRGRAREIPRV